VIQTQSRMQAARPCMPGAATEVVCMWLAGVVSSTLFWWPPYLVALERMQQLPVCCVVHKHACADRGHKLGSIC
jgi:hypothetical protein